MRVKNNPLILIDGYKVDHRRQYPEGTEYVYSNWTPRGSRIDGVNEVTLFGLQYFIKEYLMKEFGRLFTDEGPALIKDYQHRIQDYLGCPIDANHFRELRELGHLPLQICAIPEGNAVPIGFPMVTIENTNPRFFWLVNYIETLFSSILWKPCTSATRARYLRNKLNEFAERSVGNSEFVSFQAHDFSFRGMSGVEDARLSGAGHLLSFFGTDTVPAIEFLETYYPENESEMIDGPNLIGASVPATEHSVMSAGGSSPEDELATYIRLLELYPTGIVSVVSDTWDYWNVLTSVLPKLKDRILARDGKFVVRPDSGDPYKIICGDEHARPGTPEHKGTIPLLWEIFGGTEYNGYRILDQHIGAIYGDSITPALAARICETLLSKGFASTNIVFGIGSYTYEFVTRDVFGFALKATNVVIGGESRPIFKRPKTDNGTKNSAKGRLAVLSGPNGLTWVQEATPEQMKQSLLQPVWENGVFKTEYSFNQIRKNAKAGLVSSAAEIEVA